MDSEPKMQSLAPRTKLGDELRRAFTGDGTLPLVPGDYSVLELRMLEQWGYILWPPARSMWP